MSFTASTKSCTVGTTSIPRSQEDFEKQLASLLHGLSDRPAEELTYKNIAIYLLTDIITGRGRVPNIACDGIQGPANIFTGTSSYNWNGTSSPGVIYLINDSHSSEARFYAEDGVTIQVGGPGGDSLRFLIIIFYNSENVKFAVYVGPTICWYASGKGMFMVDQFYDSDMHRA
ncbi:hypothetical protein C2E23DRAFT_883787 [Lenzites betulinus]|nr:hypothetical protein C2E23DRAFT_883787 [Lenzites betulinus]